MNNKQKELGSKTIDAINFINNHPAMINSAFSSNGLSDNIWFSINQVSKHGYNKYAGKYGITIYPNNKRWNEFINLMDEDISKYPINEQSINIPYETFFGEPWEFDKIEYWYEITFSIFGGNPYSFKDQYDNKFWQRYGHIDGGSNSFEQMVIDIAKKVKYIYGDFKLEDFYTKSEIKYREDENNKSLIEIGDHRLTKNEEYIDINDSLLNIRWLEWFIETDYAKKQWDYYLNDWKKIIDKKNKLTPERYINILKEYE